MEKNKYLLAQLVNHLDVLDFANQDKVDLVSVCHDGRYFCVFYRIQEQPYDFTPPTNLEEK